MNTQNIEILPIVTTAEQESRKVLKICDDEIQLRRFTKARALVRRFVWPPAKVILYPVFLILAVILLFVGLEMFAEWRLKKTYLSEVYPNDFSMARRDFTHPVSHYDYDFVPGVCLNYDQAKGNRFEYANNAGFREPRDISIEKPADEFRIFLTGGSTAYGLGATGEAAQSMGLYELEYRETISHMMEMILNASAPISGKTIKVYNAAVWGYSYQHNLMRYLTKLREYRPDLVVSLDGANEIPLISKLTKDWNYFYEGQYNGVLRHILAYDGPGVASYLTLWLKNNSFLVTLFWSGRDLVHELHWQVLRSEGSVGGPHNERPQENQSVEEMSRRADSNVATVVRTVENYHSVLRNDGVPHIMALQPWFYSSKKPLDEKERLLNGLQGYRHYYAIPSDEMYKLLIQRLTESAQKQDYLLLDLSRYFDDVSEWVFTDWCHLTAGANYLIAKELSNLIKQRFFGRELSDGEVIRDKDGLFWDLAASGKITYAPPADSDENGPQNILNGWPGAKVYSSKAVDDDEKLEIILDMGETHPVSRLRMVWGDEDSVPDEWIIEVSNDQERWQQFVTGTRNRIDHYSLWPGFEYYASAPTEARYLRYRPTKSTLRSVRLRSWSVSR